MSSPKPNLALNYNERKLFFFLNFIFWNKCIRNFNKITYSFTFIVIVQIYNLLQQRWFELPLCLTVRFHSLWWIKIGHLPHSGKCYVIMSKLRWECGSDIHFWIIHWMSGRGAHTKNIPSHPRVVYHPYNYITIVITTTTVII